MPMPLAFTETTGSIQSTCMPYNPLIWTYIVSAIQALSHMFVPEMPPYIAGVTHWESLHIFLCQYKGPWQFCYRIMCFVCCPILSVSVAYFFWPHWDRSVLNYGRHWVIIAFFEKYKLITEIFCEAWKRTLIMHTHCNKYPYQTLTLWKVMYMPLKINCKYCSLHLSKSQWNTIPAISWNFWRQAA